LTIGNGELRMELRIY